MKAVFFFVCSLFLHQYLRAQADTAFASFANQQNNLMVEAYRQRDTAAYQKLLATFLLRYTKLGKDEQKQYKGYYSNAFYNLSCAYALLHNKKAALYNLHKAIQAGYSNYAHLMSDTDFETLRNSKEFIALAAPLRELGDYLHILKKDNRFTRSDSVQLPRFSYQDASAPELKSMRRQFNLDSIAGAGNTTSRLINLLHWVHNQVGHDGQHENGIRAINGFEIHAVARTKNIGVSCGELATLLNDCYLALGYAARKVYCMPKDSLNQDFDSHVINAVWHPQQKKWLWMDPTNDAYVMNEKGELLSIEEVRQRLIEEQPLLVNPDANWNRKSSTVKSQYLDQYMAKNLYRFSSPLDSRFDVETRGGDKTISYINLVPAGYGKFADMGSKSEWYNEKAKTRFVNYITHNPAAFWQAPPEK